MKTRNFNIGDSVKFTGFFEKGVTDYGIVGKHDYKDSTKLVIRGKMTGFTQYDYEIYLSDALDYHLSKLQ